MQVLDKIQVLCQIKVLFLKNPYERELPPQFLLLKLYQYILIGVGVIFGYLFLKYLKNYGR